MKWVDDKMTTSNVSKEEGSTMKYMEKLTSKEKSISDVYEITDNAYFQAKVGVVLYKEL